MTEHAHILALRDAYVEVTGLAVALIPVRQQMLRHIHRQGITPAEVKAVLRWLQRAIAQGARGFTKASLDFRNAMEPATMEERVIAYRQAQHRKKHSAPKPDVAQVRRLPDGRTQAVLAPAADEDRTLAIREAARVQMAELKTRLGKKA